MARLGRVLSATAAVSALAALIPGSAGAQSGATRAASRSTATPVVQVARLTSGVITGVVSDEAGGPVGGASVTAIGATMALAVTDDLGRFSTEALPVGEYVLRAHRKGFAASPRAVVRVGGAEALAPRLQMRRLDVPTGTAGATEPTVASRPIVAAGFQMPQADTPDGAKDSTTADNHSETAWRLRHIKRSILKNESNAIVLNGDDATFEDPSVFGRALGGAASFASYASSLFADLPLSGEVNLLTSSAFAPGETFATAGVPRGIAYFSLGSPTDAGNWEMRGAMTDGDLASWVVAGAFTSKAGRAHSYHVGLSYSAQDYQGGNPVALAAVRDGARNAGQIYGFDLWRVTPWLELDYGARFERYGYLAEEGGLMSPRFGMTVNAGRATRVSTLLTQRMVAPGAEEFLPRAVTGPALPPERTFAPLDGQSFRAERARGIEVMLEHQVQDTFVVGIRRFYQDVDDQLFTIFRVAPAGDPESVGHYYVGTAGSLSASGWALRLSTPPAFRVRGSVDYSVTQTQWSTRNATLAAVVPAAMRPESEEIHDITTSIETEIPETATRVYLLYRLNSGLTRSTSLQPGLDGRFDVQVNQALPFGLAGTRWEVLVGLRNMFRDSADSGSVYDELLVVRPPKRVIGGVLVRF